jgi:hypothetical protein
MVSLSGFPLAEEVWNAVCGAQGESGAGGLQAELKLTLPEDAV